MKKLSEDEARKILNRMASHLQVKKGDVLNLAVDMGGIPLPFYPIKLNRDEMKLREKKWCNFLYSTIREWIGEEGTLITHAFSYSYSDGVPFILEESPSQVGQFTEYVRNLPGAVRSCQPIFSLCAIGPMAEKILTNVGRSSFGPTSPFGRFSANNVRFISLGTTIGRSMTYLHHMEQQIGVNYRFNKIFDHPVFAGGKQLPGPWLVNLRYKGSSSKTDFSSAERELRQAGLLKELTLDRYSAQGVDILDVDQVCYEMLAKNPWAFMSKDLQIILDESKVAKNPSSEQIVRFKLDFSPVNK
jgi:aminoglycoside 3-N-acetyltransferase